MSAQKKPNPILLIATLAVVGLFLGDYVIWTPLAAVWKSQSEDITSLRQQITEGRGLIANETRYRQRIQDIVDASLPMDYSAASDILFKQYEEWCRASGFNAIEYRPRQVGRANETPRLEVEVNGYGDKESVWRFLYELETCPLALAVETIDIVSPNEEGDRLNLTVRFSGLLLNLIS